MNTWYKKLSSIVFFVATSCNAQNINLDISNIEKKAFIDVNYEQCLHWIELTNNAFIGKNKLRVFNIGLTKISVACTGLPMQFKIAAKESLGLKGIAKLTPLYNLPKSYFSEICFESSPDDNAKSLPHICLGDDFIDGQFTSLLPSIDIASYLFIKSIEIKFSTIFKRKEEYNRFILNMMLSAALNREVGW